MTAIGESLRAARQAADMSQATVAQALYITRQTVSRWEQDKTLPNIYALQDLGALYGCDLATLIGQPTASPSMEVAQMPEKKINWLSLFGVVWFNIIVGLGVAGIMLGLFLAVWGVVLGFIAAPVTLVVGRLFVGPVAHFAWQLPLALVVCGIGVALWQPAWRLTQYTWEMVRHYIRYNIHSIYA